MATLGQNVQIARIGKGWNQQALKREVGLSQKYLSQIEHDKVDPRLSIIVRLARVLNVSLDTLAGSEAPHDA